MSDDTASAFPVLDHNGNDLIMREPGLTKRELFAAMAMQGMLTCDDDVLSERLAKDAILHADALLRELAK